MGEKLAEVQRIYDRLWRKATTVLEADQGQFDPLLREKTGDPRRGATLVARPNAGVRDRVGSFLREAAAVCPGQYLYQPAELHMTVLSVIPGSASWRGEIHGLPARRAVVDEVLESHGSFSVRFRGVTLSPEAVLIQGFPQGDGLARLREKLRAALRARGLGENLDRRYVIATAHLTVMRFSHPPVNWRRLLDFLEAHRQTDFGETRFRSLQLIWGDWGASAGVTRTLREYALA